MPRLVLTEVVRWVRAVGLPLIAVAAVVVTPSLLPEAVALLLRLVPDRAVSIAWIVTVAGAIAWLVSAGVRSAMQPAKDARASDRLQELRAQSALPDHALVFVIGVLWTSPAGQRITAVDARTGGIREIWLAERTVEPGAFVLLCRAGDQSHLVDDLNAGEVASARRHECVVEARRRAHRVRGTRLARRVERAAEAEVVRAAEGLLG